MLSRRAFARTAELGQLYDANNDVLLPGSILKIDQELPTKAISINLNEFVEHDFLYAYNTDDQYKHLDIDTSLRLSLYAGLIEVGGSGKYLLNTKSNKKSIKGSFYYKLVKHDDELLLENMPFEQFDFNILANGFCKNATHFVVRRQYGADLFFTFESVNGNKEILKQIETRTEASINKVGLSIDMENENSLNKSKEDIHVSFYGDAKPPSKYKGTIDSVLECLTEIDDITQNPNQMVWDLYPLSMLKNTFANNLNNKDIPLEITSWYDMILDDTRTNILFHDWDILLENKREFENLHKIINKNDETHLRLITQRIRILQHEVSKDYKNNIIDKIKYLKKSDNDFNVKEQNKLNLLPNSLFCYNFEEKNTENTDNTNDTDNTDDTDNTKNTVDTDISEHNKDINKTVNAKEEDVFIIYQKNLESNEKNNNKSEQDVSESSKKSINFSDSDSSKARKALAELIIKNINELNEKILKYIRENKDILPKYEYSNNLISNANTQNVSSIILKPNQIKYLEGISHVFLTKDYCVSIEEYNEYIDYINKNKPIRLEHNYYYFCNFNPQSKPKSNLVRYIRLIQLDTTIELKDRWTHIRSMQIFDIDNNEICLNNKYIKLKYSSVSEEWSTGNLLDYDNSSYFHTSNGIYEWIEIDLGSNIFISKVIIKNRVDSGNPNDNPKRIIGHELQAFSENTLLGNKILVASSVIVKKDYIYEFEFTEYDGIKSCTRGYHIPNYDTKKLSHIYMFWNNRIIGKIKNTVMWYKKSELKNIPDYIFNNKFMTKLYMQCPHDTSIKNTDYKNWVCYQCNGITKITKWDNQWCLICDDCNIAVKLEDCLFYCNSKTHGKEPYPFNKDFDIDNIKPKYMGGCYIVHELSENITNPTNFEYDSVDICNEHISFDKYKQSIDKYEYNFYKSNFKVEHESTQYISPFMLYIQKNERTEYFILLNLKDNNYLNMDENFLFFNKDNENINQDINCDIEMELNREPEYYLKCEEAKKDFINMQKDIISKCKLISYSLLIQKENDIISIKKLEPTSYHLKMILIYLMKIFKSKILSNNLLRKSGKWIYQGVLSDGSSQLIIEFIDKSICECYINGIKADITMLSPFSCVARYIKSHRGIHSFYPNKNIISFISIDSSLDNLYYFEFEKKNYYNNMDILCRFTNSNKKYNDGKMYKLVKNQ